MAQIQTGTAAVLNGSPIVTASAGNDWTNAFENCLFMVPGAGAVIYTIAEVRAPADNASGRWELTLSIPYVGTTASAATYSIAKDFDPIWGFALIARGDVETGLLVNRNFAILAQGFPAPVTGPDYDARLEAIEAIIGHAGVFETLEVQNVSGPIAVFRHTGTGGTGATVVKAVVTDGDYSNDLFQGVNAGAEVVFRVTYDGKLEFIGGMAGALGLRQFTVAAAPDPSSFPAGLMAWLTDHGSGAGTYISDGTAWQKVALV